MADPAHGTTLFGISKTTIEGALSFTLATLLVVSGWLATQAVADPAHNFIYAKISSVVALVIALCTAWVRLVQGDAPKPVSPPPTTTDALGKIEPSAGGTK